MAIVSSLSADGFRLSNDLAELDLADLEGVLGWEDALRLALDELQTAPLKDRVLTAWLPRLDSHIRLADLVLFYYVRRGALFAPISVGILESWLERCIDLATHARDESLAESLVYTLGARYRDYPRLDALVRDLARESRKVSLTVQRQGDDV